MKSFFSPKPQPIVIIPEKYVKHLPDDLGNCLAKHGLLDEQAHTFGHSNISVSFHETNEQYAEHVKIALHIDMSGIQGDVLHIFQNKDWYYNSMPKEITEKENAAENIIMEQSSNDTKAITNLIEQIIAHSTRLTPRCVLF